jgi:hypothetical protein
VERYKNKVRDLEIKIQNLEGQIETKKQQPNLRLEEQTTLSLQTDKKPSLPQKSHLPEQKSAIEKLEPSETSLASNPPSKLSQPNFLEKYEYKKLNHFERMQQERGHKTQNLIEPEVPKVETGGPDDGEETGDLLEVDMLQCFISIQEYFIQILTKNNFKMDCNTSF